MKDFSSWNEDLIAELRETCAEEEEKKVFMVSTPLTKDYGFAHNKFVQVGPVTWHPPLEVEMVEDKEEYYEGIEKLAALDRMIPDGGIVSKRTIEKAADRLTDLMCPDEETWGTPKNKDLAQRMRSAIAKRMMDNAKLANPAYLIYNQAGETITMHPDGHITREPFTHEDMYKKD